MKIAKTFFFTGTKNFAEGEGRRRDAFNGNPCSLCNLEIPQGGKTGRGKDPHRNGFSLCAAGGRPKKKLKVLKREGGERRHVARTDALERKHSTGEEAKGEEEWRIVCSESSGLHERQQDFKQEEKNE